MGATEVSASGASTGNMDASININKNIAAVGLNDFVPVVIKKNK